MEKKEIIKQSNKQLIPCTDKEKVLTESKQSFESFLKVYSECGGKVNDTTIRLIKDSIDKEGYTIVDIEDAVKKCFSNEQFFNWANIKKYLDVDNKLYDTNKIRKINAGN